MGAHFLQEVCSLSQDERIADPVKPVLPDHLLLRHLRVERIRVNVRGYTPRMERRIEVRDIDRLGQLLRSQLDQSQRSRIMPKESGQFSAPKSPNETRQIQGCKVRQMFNLTDRLLTQHDRIPEQPSMHDPMHNQLDLPLSVFLQTFVLSEVPQEESQSRTLVSDLPSLSVLDITPLVRVV